MSKAKTEITPEDVRHIADMARLELSDTEMKAAATDLQGVLQHFSEIQNIDTTGVSTADDASGLKNIARTDVAKPESLATHDELLELAPNTQDRHVKTKAVFADSK